MAQDRNTEELIIEAAKKIFVQRGLAGARMQDIADEAGINKAMLHYYYRSKEKLFEIIFDEAFGKVIGQLGSIVTQDMPVKEKIIALVDSYIGNLSQTPYLPLFILNEVNQNPERIVQKLKSQVAFPNMMVFLKEIVEAGKKGIIREVSPVQLFMNLLSMCIFPFAARPLIQGVMQMDNIQYDMLIEERKKLVADVLLKWIEP